MSIYQTYRPQTFAELSGQNVLVQTLEGALKKDTVGHAYLFVGVRGTGKTTTARLLAKAINCLQRKTTEPCNACENCLAITQGNAIDVIEIDAASNTGVENIRQLREEARLSPTSAKYKVYIIDEAHMLSNGAWNALLKILEEPPKHVVFIMATTESQKIPKTILSRCQRFQFYQMNEEIILQKLQKIVKEEGVSSDTESLQTIARAAGGSMRDAESLLEQMISLQNGALTDAATQLALGITDHKLILETLCAMVNKETSQALSLVEDASQKNISMDNFTRDLIFMFRQMLFVAITGPKESLSTNLSRTELDLLRGYSSQLHMQDIIAIIDELITASSKIRISPLPQIPLELALVRITQNTSSNSKEKAASANIAKIKPNQSKLNVPNSKATHALTKISTNSNVTASNLTSPHTNATHLTIEQAKKCWPKFLEELGAHHHGLKVMLTQCALHAEKDGELVIAAPYAFYADKLNESGNRLTIEQLLDTIGKAPAKVRFTLLNADHNNAKEDSELLSNATEIFG